MQRKACYGKDLETHSSCNLFTLCNDYLKHGMQLSKRTVIIVIQPRHRPSRSRLG